jgi:hypothetical protein
METAASQQYFRMFSTQKTQAAYPTEFNNNHVNLTADPLLMCLDLVFDFNYSKPLILILNFIHENFPVFYSNLLLPEETLSLYS